MLNTNIKIRSGKIMRYIPKSKRDAVNEAFKDSDGYWIFLKEGWNAVGGKLVS